MYEVEAQVCMSYLDQFGESVRVNAFEVNSSIIFYSTTNLSVILY